jgi:hypothetical protein
VVFENIFLFGPLQTAGGAGAKTSILAMNRIGRPMAGVGGELIDAKEPLGKKINAEN